MFYAYLYRDPTKVGADGKGEPIYAGKGTGDRCYVHLKRTDHHPLTHKLKQLRAKGVEPLIEVYPAESEDAAFAHEDELIARYGLKVDGTGTLCNLAKGELSGRALADDVKKRISEKLSGRTLCEEHCEKIKRAMTGNSNCVGRKYSQATIDKMSASQKARCARLKALKEQEHGI